LEKQAHHKFHALDKKLKPFGLEYSHSNSFFKDDMRNNQWWNTIVSLGVENESFLNHWFDIDSSIP